MKVCLFDTKPYDRDFFLKAPGARDVDWTFQEFRLNDQTAHLSKGAQAVCIFVNDRADRGAIEVLSSLGVKLIALRCAGFNNVDLEAAKASQIGVVRVPAYSPHAVAEHAVALLLTLNRKIHRAYNRVREQNFSLNGFVGFDVYGKTIGIIGTGKIGRITAELFLGFGTRVLAHDPFPSPEWAQQKGVEYVPFDQLLSQSDVVSLHLPLSRETHHLLNKSAFEKMKKGAFLINTSRGKLVDTKALVTALKSGKLGGIALDVYEEEEGVFFEDLSNQPLQDDVLSRLLSFPNVLVTSHQAFFTHEALSEIARVTVENILRFGRNEPWIPGTQL